MDILWWAAPEIVTIRNYCRSTIFLTRWLLKMSCNHSFAPFSLLFQCMGWVGLGWNTGTGSSTRRLPSMRIAHKFYKWWITSFVCTQASYGRIPSRGSSKVLEANQRTIPIKSNQQEREHCYTIQVQPARTRKSYTISIPEMAGHLYWKCAQNLSIVYFEVAGSERT